MELNTNRPLRAASINGLAVVGFVALVFAGMTLAIYAARFVPTAVERVASASVYLSSFFNGTTESTVEVVPGDTTPAVTLPIAPASTTTAPAETKPVATVPATPTPGTPSNTAYVQGSLPVKPSTGPLTGLPDLSVHIIAVGYLETAGVTVSFFASSTVPKGKQGAVKFTITNLGTNTSGTWSFSAELPTSPSYTFESSNQTALLPGEHIDFTLGFDRGREGAGREVTVSVDQDHRVSEANEANNSQTATVTILK